MNGTFVGLNISSDEVRVAEITQENGGWAARTLWHGRPSKGDAGATSDLIKAVLRDHPPKTPRALLVISSEDLRYRDFSFPFASSKRVAGAIRFEISAEYAPQEYVFDQIETLPGEPGKKAFLAAIVRKDILNRRIREAEEAGLRVIGITCDLSTLGNYFVDDEDALVMEMAQRQTLFALYSRRVPVLVRNIPMGLRDIGQGSAETRPADLRPLISELKRTILSFAAKTGLTLNTVHLSGSLLERKDLVAALKEAVDFNFVDRSPESASFRLPDPTADPNLYATLLGAAGWKKKTKAFDFFRDDFLRSDRASLGRSYFRRGVVVMACLLVAVLCSSWLKVATLQKRERFLTNETRKVFTTSFPQVTRVVDEIRQAKNLLESRKTETGGTNPLPSLSILDTLELMSRTIPKEIPFQVVNLFWERGRLEIDGRTDSFKTVNAIQELLAGSKGFPDVTISNARSKGDGQDVEFKVTLRVAR